MPENRYAAGQTTKIYTALTPQNATRITAALREAGISSQLTQDPSINPSERMPGLMPIGVLVDKLDKKRGLDAITRLHTGNKGPLPYRANNCQFMRRCLERETPTYSPTLQ
jgi:hypothetical protein